MSETFAYFTLFFNGFVCAFFVTFLYEIFHNRIVFLGFLLLLIFIQTLTQYNIWSALTSLIFGIWFGYQVGTWCIPKVKQKIKKWMQE
jgi:hypothetical protein